MAADPTSDDIVAECHRLQAEALAGDPFGRLIEDWPMLPDDCSVQDGVALADLTVEEYRAKVAANRAARIMNGIPDE